MVIYIFYRPKPLILLDFRITTYHGKAFLRKRSEPLIQLGLRAYHVSWYVFRFAGNYMVFSTKQVKLLPRIWW